MNQRPSKFCIVALPFERTTSFLKGTKNGPDAILSELSYLDTFDFGLGYDPFIEFEKSVVKPHDHTILDPEIQQTIAATAVSELLNDNNFVVSIGGEHTVSLGPIRAAKAAFGEIGVVQLDAHADLRHSYQDSIHSHACVMRRVTEMNIPTLGVGIRTISKDESDYIKTKNMNIVSSKQVIESNTWYTLLDKLPNKIYLTVDMDFFDPAHVKNVGTPEPGGPSWEHATRFIDYLFATKDVVAADVVELMPGPKDAASIRMAARLVSGLAGLSMN